ncbi:hypothetical protein HZC31_03785 [Candidatus Woesearchaeota archaeon]|nr:hypothetical protein [Candidatus Woesearchaeota archaeon]
MGIDEQARYQTEKPDGENATPKKTRPHWSINSIKPKTLKRVGLLVGGILVAGALIHYVPQTRMARAASSYFTAALEAVGIEAKITNPAGNLEAEVSEALGNVREVFTTNANQMRGGMYNQVMFTVYDDFLSVEALFLANGRSEERREYIQKRLGRVELETLLVVYSQVAPKADVVQTVTGMQSVFDSYLARSLDDRTRGAYYLERSLWPLTQNLLNEEGKKAVAAKLYDTMSPESIVETAVPYITTPQARAQTVEALLGSMTPEERGTMMQRYTTTLPQAEVDALAVALVPSMSTDGYTQVSDAITDKKIDAGFDKGKEVLDTIKEYVKN